ncbi:MAG: caspase family protein [Deltaproteobacteria bacterium]|nr:caspase family protein [Deltaproteobacteria bacterium]
MRAVPWPVPLAALGLCLLSDGAAAADDPPARRFAIMVASNHGGADRPVLRHAHSDARAFSDVIVELGGVLPGDVKTLLEPGPDEVLAAFADAAALVRAAAQSGARVDLVAYYSGHSDEEGILLGERRLGYTALRAAVDAVPASVRVVVLDSCSSGALLRTKGGVRVAPFLIDQATDVAGTAFLLSSSADEPAQESDRIGGSFFTQSLITGLRGAADFGRDGTVTLTEAYRFAFDETLARTERTSGGAQHPAWDMKLSGAGDFVITDLRDASSQLVLDEDVAGRVFIRGARGELLAELQKQRDQPLHLSVPAGSYSLLVKGVGTSSADVEVLRGGATVVRDADLARVQTEPTTARGDVEERSPRPDAGAAWRIGGTAASISGAVAFVALGSAALYLTAVASSPAGDGDTKQAALDFGPWILVGTGAGALVGLAGAATLAMAPAEP